MNIMIQALRHRVVVVIRGLLSILIPVKKGKLLFQSFPDYADNSRAFSDYLIEHTDYHLFWSVNNAENYQNNSRITFIERDGGNTLLGKLKFIYHTVSAQYLFSTHAAFFYANGRRQKYVCLWHGTPLKRIAILQNPANKNYLSNTSCILCSSKYYVPIMAECFGWSEERIIPIGIPRNDWLFRKSDSLDKLGLVKGNNEKLIVYLPTFRKTRAEDRGDSEHDVYRIGEMDFGSEKCCEEMNTFLKKYNVKLIVKPHPSDPNQQEKTKYSNIFIIPHKKLLENDVQLNSLLHYADALITDFSGVYTDYLNLDRPIGFVLSDLEEYTRKRGFLYENPLDFMPGVRIYSERDFMDFCEDVANNHDTSKSERERLHKVYNDYRDDENCRRLADFLKM